MASLENYHMLACVAILYQLRKQKWKDCLPVLSVSKLEKNITKNLKKKKKAQIVSLMNIVQKLNSIFN